MLWRSGNWFRLEVRPVRPALAGIFWMICTLLPLSLAHADKFEDCRTKSGNSAIAACQDIVSSEHYSAYNKSKAYLFIGVELLGQGDYKEAISNMQSAIKMNPKDPSIYSNLANVYVKLFRYSEAMNNYTAAINIDQNFYPALLSRCYLENILGQYDAAVTDCKRAQTIGNKNDTQALLGLGNASLNLAVAARRRAPDEGAAELESALNDYDKAAQADKRDIGALLGKGRALMEQGKVLKDIHRFERAKEVLDKAANIEPRNVSVLNNRCWVLAIIGDLDSAMRDCNSALSVFPDDPASLDSRAFVYLKKCDLKNAINDYQKAIILDNHRVSSLYALGLIYSRGGFSSDTTKYIDLALAKSPEIAEDFKMYGLPREAVMSCRQ